MFNHRYAADIFFCHNHLERPAASANHNIWQSFLKRVNVLTLAEVTPSPSSNYHPGLRRLVRNLLMSVQNSGMNCPTEYATSPSWMGSKLLCTIIYSIQIPNSLLSHCHHIPPYFIYYLLFSLLCACITSSHNKCLSVCFFFFICKSKLCIHSYLFISNIFNH